METPALAAGQLPVRLARRRPAAPGFQVDRFPVLPVCKRPPARDFPVDQLPGQARRRIPVLEGCLRKASTPNRTSRAAEQCRMAVPDLAADQLLVLPGGRPPADPTVSPRTTAPGAPAGRPFAPGHHPRNWTEPNRGPGHG